MASDTPPPKKVGTPEGPTPARTPLTSGDIESEVALQAGFAAQLDKKGAAPKSNLHAGFGKMLGSEATAEQIDRFVNTWVQDMLRDMRKQEKKLQKTWKGMS